ncbi:MULTISPECIES: hypothetical protein [Sphingomonas]|uniref:hypothetical protein n=1 Tax=Sphingomonas TaxID=13687 RepID=UPI000AE68244|nr:MULTISPECIES: hypothetical protein [Sphingomonas]MBY0300230.1 hypothetical protein [Sphingomonas ginsenosidimutans]
MRAALLAIAAAALSFLAARQAILLSTRSHAPHFALQLNPHDPVALTKAYYQSMVGPDGTPQQATSVWVGAAHAALRAEPLSSGPLQILLGAMGPGDERLEHSRQLIAAASAITRRELPVELWQIEDAVSRQDIHDALVHYDRALSVHPDAGAFLYPVLTSAASQEGIRAELAPLLARNRLWVTGFLGYYAARTEDYPAAIDLFARYGGSRRLPSHRAYETVLLRRLVASGNGGLARTFGHRVAGFDIGGPDSFGLSPRTTDGTFAPLSWQLDDDDTVTADFDPQDGLAIGIPPTERGIGASRVVILEPGRWILDEVLEWPPATPIADLAWEIRCLTRTSGEIIARIAPTPQIGRHRSTDGFVVPPSCAAVQFDLVVQGPVNDGQAEVTLKSVALRRSSNR